ncbi:MAG: DUF805 domain-containing protein [Verrucomicrobiota bacterium]
MSENIYQAPAASQVANVNEGEHTPLSLKQKLFGFKGRISRAGYWGYAVGFGILFIIPFYIFLFGAMWGWGALDESSSQPANLPIAIIATLLSIASYAVVMWVSFAIIAKRYHDRNKSGWWSLIAFIPYIGGIWILIECGCLAGDRGHNQYGSDPLLADGKRHL